MNQVNAVLMDNFFYITVAFGTIFLVMLFVIILMKMDISEMRRQYKKMMVGSEGANLENMLSEHSDRMNRIGEVQKMTGEEITKINDLLDKAITRVAIVRFDAFEDTSSDLSYCVALLDNNNTGIIISGINGREEARTYAKPIVNGDSVQYKLTKEEEKVLQEAMVSPVRRSRR